MGGNRKQTSNVIVFIGIIDSPMYSSKQTILETVALLKAHGIKHLVISPGSRNAPLIQSFIVDPFFHCYSVVDERSASFMAIGMIQQLGKPVALCCTSGTAVLNYGPAIAEAHYQHLPLIVLSADRSPAWIDQLDGQTIPQSNVFPDFFHASVTLPEINTTESHWHCNRLINEALMACTHDGGGPVHLNIPISEPLFDFSVRTLPEVRVIHRSTTVNACLEPSMQARWQAAQKRLIVVGQLPVSNALNGLLDTLVQESTCVVLCEHLSNLASDRFIRDFDTILGTSDEGMRAELVPDLLITLGGHVVSKQLKKWLRSYTSIEHWHIAPDNGVADTYQSLREVLVGDPTEILRQLPSGNDAQPAEAYLKQWEHHSAQIPAPSAELPFSDLSVTGCLLKRLPQDASLFVANSSPVRNIQLYPRPKVEKIVCNRGTNGIEGTLSTAIGLALEQDKPTVALMGDLSFFHDLSGLWNPFFPANLRVMVINNGGGGIFHQLEGLTLSLELEAYMAANHQCSVEKWVEAAGLTYLRAATVEELNEHLTTFFRNDIPTGVVLEVITSSERNTQAMKRHQSDIKQAQQ